MNAPRVLRQPLLAEGRRALLTSASPGAALAEVSSASTQATPLSAALQASETTRGEAHVEARAEAGHAEGLRQGLQQGLAEAQARIEREIESRWHAQKAQWEQAERRRAEEHQQRLAALDKLLETVDKAMPERFMALERQAIALAYEALCKVCGPGADPAASAEPAAPSDRASLLADLLRQGVQQLRGQTWLGVRLNPKDLQALMASAMGGALTARHPQVRFLADDSLEPMAVLIDTDHGQLDAGLATQLAQLRALWAGAS